VSKLFPQDVAYVNKYQANKIGSILSVPKDEANEQLRMMNTRKLICCDHMARMGVSSNANEILMWKPLEKWLLGRLRRR
jgi:hypothetical protein